MTRILLICGVGYGLGVVAVASLRAVRLWDTIDLAALIGTVALEGLLWPLYLLELIA